jgi:hypothetical protein
VSPYRIKAMFPHISSVLVIFRKQVVHAECNKWTSDHMKILTIYIQDMIILRLGSFKDRRRPCVSLPPCIISERIRYLNRITDVTSSVKRFQSPWPDSNNISLTIHLLLKLTDTLWGGVIVKLIEYKLHFACLNNSDLEGNRSKINVLVSWIKNYVFEPYSDRGYVSSNCHFQET